MTAFRPPVTIRVGDRIRTSMALAGSLSFRPVTLTVRAIGPWDYDAIDLLCEADDAAFASSAFEHFHWRSFAPGGGCEIVPAEDAESN